MKCRLLYYSPLLLILVLGLSGCPNDVLDPVYPKISFTHRQPIKLAIGAVEIKNEYFSPTTGPNVEHEFPVSPAKAVIQWVQGRLIPVGKTGSVIVIIRDASVLEVPLPLKRGLKEFFTRQQSHRYDGTIDVRIEIRDSDNNAKAVIQSVAKMSRTVPENLSIKAREEIWFKLTEEMMGDLDKSLENLIYNHWKVWLR